MLEPEWKLPQFQVAECHGRQVRVLQMVGAGAQGTVFKAQVPWDGQDGRATRRGELVFWMSNLSNPFEYEACTPETKGPGRGFRTYFENSNQVPKKQTISNHYPRVSIVFFVGFWR